VIVRFATHDPPPWLLPELERVDVALRDGFVLLADRREDGVYVVPVALAECPSVVRELMALAGALAGPWPERTLVTLDRSRSDVRVYPHRAHAGIAVA
jgi:hypothetical protein